MDFDIQDGKVDMDYTMLPVITSIGCPLIRKWKPIYRSKCVKQLMMKYCWTPYKDRFYNPQRLGKTYEDILSEKTLSDRLLYRRGNFYGNVGSIFCTHFVKNMMPTVQCQPVFGGVTTLKGDWITMEDVMSQCSMTYGETYSQR